MAAVTICSDFGAQKYKVWHCFQCFPIYFEVMGPDAMMIVFWMLSFKPTFSFSSFTFIKRLFSSSSLSATRMVSSAYLRLLIFIPAILIPACASSSLPFHMMYSAYKLNKQGDNIQPWHIPFLIWNQSFFPCTVLSVASWPAYRFLRGLGLFPWNRKWQPTPVFLSGQSHGYRSLTGYSADDHTELDTTEWLHFLFFQICRWHHPYGRKWKRTKEPLYESERGE